MFRRSEHLGRDGCTDAESAVTAADTVTVRYDKPATNPLRDTAGNEVATFGDQVVTFVTTPATLVSNTGQTQTTCFQARWINGSLFDIGAQIFTTGSTGAELAEVGVWIERVGTAAHAGGQHPLPRRLR